MLLLLKPVRSTQKIMSESPAAFPSVFTFLLNPPLSKGDLVKLSLDRWLHSGGLPFFVCYVCCLTYVATLEVERSTQKIMSESPLAAALPSVFTFLLNPPLKKEDLVKLRLIGGCTRAVFRFIVVLCVLFNLCCCF